MDYVKISETESRMRIALAGIYTNHPELSTFEKVGILQALGIGEIAIGQLLSGTASLDSVGCVHVADTVR